MILLAQQGYGRSDKIERGIRDQNLSGVILSPRDTSVESLTNYVTTLRGEFGDELEILFDPQFYASVLPDATDRHLPEYPYYRPGLGRSDFLAGRDVSRIVRDTISYQASLDLTSVVSPTIAFDSFSESYSQTALQLGAESVSVYQDIVPDGRLLVSFVIGESALADIESVYEFLDIVTSWDVDGFYFIVESGNTRYPSTIDSERLANLMYIVYSLAEINDREIALGYTDFSGVLLGAVGASSMATGWYAGLRQFSRTRWLPSSGGRAPNARYSSYELMNSITVVPELLSAHQVGLLDVCLSDTLYDHVFLEGNPGDVVWQRAEQCLQHWAVLANLLEFTDADSIEERLSLVGDVIGQSMENYQLLQDAGAVFEGPTGPTQLDQWTLAIEQFRQISGL